MTTLDRDTLQHRARLRPDRRLLAGVVAIVALSSGVLAGCSDDEEPPATSVTQDTNMPSETTSSSTPDGDAGGSGAKPGRDPEEIDPPGGTTPVPDAGGANNDSAGDQTEGP